MHRCFNYHYDAHGQILSTKVYDTDKMIFFKVNVDLAFKAIVVSLINRWRPNNPLLTNSANNNSNINGLSYSVIQENIQLIHLTKMSA